MAIRDLTIADLRNAYARGELTPVDVVEDVLAAVDERDGDVNAYITVLADSARASARAMTEKGEHRRLPLGGIPVAIKDNICISGGRTTCGSEILNDYHSPYDATVVSRLKDAGAIIIGKTNLDEFAMGSSTENSAFGPTRNPWDLSRAPGGSSGGSAAAVAAGTAPAALGSDTGGSIRQPASFCGVVGIKPTYGRVSRYGLVAFASSLDQVGPFARTVSDAALVLQCIAGNDPRDATSVDASLDLNSLDGGALKGKTVGVPRAFISDKVDETVERNFDVVAGLIGDLGGKVREVTLPHAEFAIATYYIIANAEASANLARYDGVKYGHRSARAEDLMTMYTRSRSEGFGAEVKRRILLGTYVLSAGYYDAYYRQAQKVRSLVIRDFADVFADVDVMMLPTSPCAAFELGVRVEDPIQMYLSDVLTIPVSLAGLPAVSIPTGLAPGRLPLGVQVVGRALDERAVLRVAREIESAIDFKERAYG